MVRTGWPPRPAWLTDARLRRAGFCGAGALAIVEAAVGPVHLSGVHLSILVGVLATAIAALGLDLLVARTGQLSLAHAAFLGVGAFTAINVGGHGAPWPIALASSIAVTAATGAVVGLPSLRIRGLQIAIATLAFQVFAERFLFVRTDVQAADRTFERPGFLTSDGHLFLFAVAALVLVLIMRQRIGATRAGRAFVAVRDIEPRAQCFGVDRGPHKLLAYTLSGAIVGLAGGLFALKAGNIGTATDPFKLLESLELVAIVVLGGAGSAAGILSAALLVKGVPQFIDKIPLTHLSAQRYVPIVSAALLVVSIVGQPEGIGGVYRRAWSAVRRRLPGALTPTGEAAPPPRPQLGTQMAQADELRLVPRRLAFTLPVPVLLSARGVSVRYGGVSALSDLSLDVRRGEIVGLIGANGAGKSTFFNAVSGLAPVTGSITYGGRELVGAPPTGRSAMGVVRTFQDMGLVRAETVAENLLLAQTWLAGYGPASGILGLGVSLSREAELRRRAGLALEVFGLSHLAGERLGDLPYGTMRIVEIAAAVAAGPDLLMLDEASAGLGPEESHQLADRFLSLRADLGLTLVVIEHHVPLIAKVCDYVYCLESGALIAEGRPAEVTAQPQVVASFLGRGGAATGGTA